MINNKLYYFKVQDIGPQGAAAAVQLPPDSQPWFSVQDSAPHIILLIAQGHEACDLGPMVKTALRVPVSADKQCVRISLSTCDE